MALFGSIHLSSPFSNTYTLREFAALLRKGPSGAVVGPVAFRNT